VNWLDVAGPPGVGKSALCDPLWGPHDIPIDSRWPPVEWHDFCNEIMRLLGLVKDHPSFVAAVRMNRRSMRKMAVVHGAELITPEKAKKPGIYIQTGFVQRGLGFGWRLVDMGKPVEELWHFFRLMPVSLGVAFLVADEAVLSERNKAREAVKETAHENRAFMAPLMRPAIEFAREVLHERGVPVCRIDTTGDIDEARSELVEFANAQSDYAPPAGFGGKAPALSSPPVWW
jgi:hypothetical protein